MDLNASDHNPPEVDRSRRRLVWAALLVAVLVPILIIEGPGARLLREFGLTDRDEAFTELYFPDLSQLPDQLSPGAPLEFDFSIRNNEGTATNYKWEARLGAVGSSFVDSSGTLLDSGELRLDDGAIGGVHVENVTPVTVGCAVVGVVLVGRDEAIRFPVEIVSAGRDTTADRTNQRSPGDGCSGV